MNKLGLMHWMREECIHVSVCHVFVVYERERDINRGWIRVFFLFLMSKLSFETNVIDVKAQCDYEKGPTSIKTTNLAFSSEANTWLWMDD